MTELTSSNPRAGLASNVKALAGAASLFLLAAAGHHAVAAGGITIENPWMQLIIRTRPAGGYFVLHNETDNPIELTGASSSGCGMVMLHQSKEVNGVETMLPVKNIKVPAHGTLSFVPGGYHLMCMQPQNTMVAGKTVPVVLTFADGRTLTADFPVKSPGG